MSNSTPQRIVRPFLALAASVGLLVGIGGAGCGASSNPPEQDPFDSTSSDSETNASGGASGNPVACLGGQVECSGVCIDVQSDGNHCGGCGLVCPVGQVCSAGRCSTSCASAPGTTVCGNGCVDVRSDPANCGSCGATCPPGTSCRAGICTCPPGLAACSTGCVDTQTDVNNCGGCGQACPVGKVCSAGACIDNSSGFEGGVPGAGGAAIGGSGAAGSSTGGNAAGGSAATGGSPAGGPGPAPATGGSAAGGSTGGGSAAGGVPSGGASTGGAATGGSAPAEPSNGCGTPKPAQAPSTLTVDTTARTFIVDVPAGYEENTPFPIVFGFHGMSTSGEMYRGAFYGNLASTMASEYILVYPDGLGDPTTWDTQGDKDLQFFDALLALMKSTYCIDAKRVFATGHSMGGLMSNAIGCKRGDVVRAIAPISGAGPSMGGFDPGCVGQVAAWLAHGTSDGTVDLSSGEGSRDYWVEANHCDINATTAPSPDYPCVEYGGCDAGFPVRWCQYEGGHEPPDFGPEGIYDFFSLFK